MPDTTLENFTEEDVVRWLGEREVDKAASYVRNVRNLEVEENRIRGLVPGTARAPYVTVIRLLPQRKGPRDIVSGCTCPVATHCKHVAALLLRAIEERDAADRVSPGVLSWVKICAGFPLPWPRKRPGRPASSSNSSMSSSTRKISAITALSCARASIWKTPKNGGRLIAP
jgi:hypothetical protein